MGVFSVHSAKEGGGEGSATEYRVYEGEAPLPLGPYPSPAEAWGEANRLELERFHEESRALLEGYLKESRNLLERSREDGRALLKRHLEDSRKLLLRYLQGCGQAKAAARQA